MFKRYVAFGPAVVLTGIAIGLITQATAQTSTSKTDQATQKAIQAVLDKYQVAFNDKNAAGVAATFAEDGVFMLPTPTNQVHSGREALEKFFEGSFKRGVSDLHGKVEEAHAVGNVAWARGSFTQMSTTTMPQSHSPEHIRGMFGGVYEREGSEYKIKQLTVFLIPNAPAQSVSGSTSPPTSEKPSK